MRQQFNYETDLFRLRVSFTGDKLSFELDDLDERVIYSKQYTDDDFGKDIHKKVDLNDLFNTFLLIKTNQKNNQLVD